MKIGIPRGLYYYEQGDMWECFLKALGEDVILSDKTDEKIIKEGAALCTDGACLPIKAYHGHIANLMEKGAEALFMPRIVKPYNDMFTCPKVMGVNDMIKSSFECNVKILEPTLSKNLQSFCFRTGAMLGYFPYEIIRAYKAMVKYKNSKEFKNAETEIQGEINVAVIGHPYLVFDENVNMHICSVLKELGCRAVTAERFDRASFSSECDVLKKHFFWVTGTESMGFMNVVSKSGIDGILYLSSFGCGPDSFVLPFLRKNAEKGGIMFTEISFDEHTGEEGVRTRAEAFVDMIKRKKEPVL